jgi:hypothetical protein
MSSLGAEDGNKIEAGIKYLREKGMIGTEEKVNGQDFSTLATKLAVENTVCILRIMISDNKISSRRVLATLTEVPADITNNQIYVKPDAVFGIALSVFIFFITFIGVMCLYGVNTPKGVASKPFKFGREL